MKDAFGDRMKEYEKQFDYRVAADCSTYMRLDGRSFSKFTKGLPRPYDPVFSQMMVDVTIELVKEFKVDIGYTQSDEISLGWKRIDFSKLPPTYSGILPEFPFFSGRIDKLTSVVSSFATAKLNQLCYARGGEYRYRAMEMLPSFDARIFQPATTNLLGYEEVELINAFLWREQDCAKNSVSMAARAVFSHSQLQGKQRDEMVAMMAEQGVVYEDYPDFFKRGTYVRKELFESVMGLDVPEQYRTTEPVIRSRVVAIPYEKIRECETTMDRVKFWFPEN